MAVNLNSHQALSGSSDCTLKLWDLQSGRLLHSLVGNKSEVNALTISPEGRFALSGSHDRTIRFWDLRTGELLGTFAGRGHGMGRMAETLNLFGSLDEVLKSWRPRSKHAARTIHQCLRLPALRMLQAWVFMMSFSEWVSAVATTSNGRCALATSHDHSLRLWNLRTARLIRAFVGHTDHVHSVAVGADNRRTVWISGLHATLMGHRNWGASAYVRRPRGPSECGRDVSRRAPWPVRLA